MLFNNIVCKLIGLLHATILLDATPLIIIEIYPIEVAIMGFDTILHKEFSNLLTQHVVANFNQSEINLA